MNEILSKIEHWSLTTPDKIALIDPEGICLTYKELMNAARATALLIQSRNLNQTGLIGIFLSQCYALPICLLAIWMTGAAYVPLDPIYPKQRILDIIKTVDLSCIFTDQHSKSILESSIPNLHCIDIQDLTNINSNWNNQSIKIQKGDKGDLAYIIFTSGSTGRPKGVKVTLNNLLNILLTFAKKLSVSPADRQDLPWRWPAHRRRSEEGF